MEKIIEVKDDIDIDKLDKETINRILNVTIPIDDSGFFMVNRLIKDKGNNHAVYYPKENCIEFDINALKKWLEVNNEDLKKDYDIDDEEELKKNLLIFAIFHELSHAKQNLIATGKIKEKKEIYQVYKDILDIFNKNKPLLGLTDMYHFIQIIRYYFKADFYTLERNAQIDAATRLKNLNTNNKAIYKLFSDINNKYILLGYRDDNLGTIYKTYKDTMMLNKFKKLDYSNLSEEERALYGFPIKEDTRKKVIKKVRENDDK